jgi:hypothetical protein
MSDPPEIPADVRRFLDDRIDTVPHLEALVLLWESAGRSWSAEEVAGRVYISAESARSVLSNLQRHGLIAVTEQSPPAYSYDPAWDESGQLMPRIAATYTRHVVACAQLIHSKASPGVREFARAFQLKKD